MCILPHLKIKFFKSLLGISRRQDFPGSSVVKNLPSNAWGTGMIPDRGAKIPHASWPKKLKNK